MYNKNSNYLEHAKNKNFDYHYDKYRILKNPKNKNFDYHYNYQYPRKNYKNGNTKIYHRKNFQKKSRSYTDEVNEIASNLNFLQKPAIGQRDEQIEKKAINLSNRFSVLDDFVIDPPTYENHIQSTSKNRKNFISSSRLQDNEQSISHPTFSATGVGPKLDYRDARDGSVYRDPCSTCGGPPEVGYYSPYFNDNLPFLNAFLDMKDEIKLLVDTGASLSALKYEDVVDKNSITPQSIYMANIKHI